MRGAGGRVRRSGGRAESATGGGGDFVSHYLVSGVASGDSGSGSGEMSGSGVGVAAGVGVGVGFGS